jgi:pimeloyl-ACP methyl ester carboxylesterase
MSDVASPSALDGGLAAAAQGDVRAVFLTTRPDSVFAMVHMPATRRGEGTGVIVCPAFAGEDLCNYRVRRAWAEALAQAGHPALRLDLPGMGDSAGSPRAPDRVDAWKAALSDAARWLRDEADCARIAALGIGFGGMLAWLAAADGAPIDDLILWGVPTSGRRLLREVRAAGLFEIERDLELEAVAPGGATLPDGVLDVAGQVSTTATIDALSQVDLMTLELPEPTSRRVLIFERDGVVGDVEACGYFRERGADVTTADGNSYGAMMRYVEIAAVPTAAIARSVSWLADSDTFGRRSAQSPPTSAGEPPQALGAIELNHDGIVIRETMLTIEVDAVTLRGVVTEPLDPLDAGICVVFFAGGSDRRIGQRRASPPSGSTARASATPTATQASGRTSGATTTRGRCTRQSRCSTGCRCAACRRDLYWSGSAPGAIAHSKWPGPIDGSLACSRSPSHFFSGAAGPSRCATHGWAAGADGQVTARSKARRSGRSGVCGERPSVCGGPMSDICAAGRARSTGASSV